MYAAGETPEAIATRENVSVFAVKDAILAVDTYQKRVGHDMVHMRINEAIIDHVDDASRVIREGMVAMQNIVLRNADGSQSIEQVIDYEMRRKHVETFTKLIDIIQPKTPPVAVNVTQNNANISGGGGRSFEERLRSIREKNHLRNDEAVIDAPAEEIDDDEDGDIDDGEYEDDPPED